MSLRASLKSLAAVLLLCTATPAAAQEIGQDALGYLGTFAFADSLKTWDQAKEFGAESVLDHTRDGFLPVGVRLPGGHLFFPSVQVKTEFDDNIFRSPDKVGDLRTTLSANAELQSNLPRHMVKLTIGGDRVDFKDHQNLSFTNGTARADWRLDLNAANSIGGSFQTGLSHDDNFLPAAPDVVSSAVPVWSSRAAIGYMHDAGRTALAVGADFQRTYVYDTPTYGGGIADESKGDNDDLGVFALAIYRFSPGYQAFVAGRIDHRTALHERAAYSNNDNYRVETGLVYEVNPLLKFNVMAGYNYVKHDSDLQYNFGTTIFKAGLQWLPTRRLTVSLNASRQLEQTLKAPEFGQLSEIVQARLQYDIYHNIIGRADASVERDQFIGSTRIDNVWSAGVALDYLFNENLVLTLGYEHRERASNDFQYSFDDNRIMATLKLSQ